MTDPVKKTVPGQADPTQEDPGTEVLQKEEAAREAMQTEEAAPEALKGQPAAQGPGPERKPVKLPVKWIAAAAALAAAVLAVVFFTTGFWIRLPWMDQRYYMERGRVVKENWIQNGENYYYLDENGIMVTGLRKIDGAVYWFSESDGAMQTGWKVVHTDSPSHGGEQRMYFDPDTGQSVTGWIQIDEEDYWFSDDGIMQTGWCEIEGEKYFFDSRGKKQTGWHSIGGEKVFLGKDGTLQTGWVEYKGKKYLLDKEGHPLTGRQNVKGSTYFFDDDGVLQTGWVEYKGKKYYCGEDGKMQTGRVGSEEGDFYLTDDGSVEAGWHTDGDSSFYVCLDGTAVDPQGETGSYGRLIVPSAGLDVRLYSSNTREEYQDIVDAENSALVVQERRDMEPVIADRRSQGFDLSGVEEGSSAVIVLPGGGLQEYECVRKTTGVNLGRDVIDMDSHSLWEQNEGGICAYSNAGEEAKDKINVIFWEPVSRQE
ncbi:MAG: hypothetical protein Q4F43_01110 [Eubacteriales bacterium]|nr:hypothetical protein [Eubacteriales bacterium]